MAELLTASDYARHRQVSPAAVSKAIETGRLKHCLVNQGGKVRITSAAMADLEWDANTNSAKAPPSTQDQAPVLPLDGDDDSVSLRDATAAEKNWKAKLAELEYKERSGTLVDAKEVEAHIVDDYSRCRTRLLGIPGKAKARAPHLSLADIALIDSLVREALEQLADGIDIDPAAASNTPSDANEDLSK